MNSFRPVSTRTGTGNVEDCKIRLVSPSDIEKDFKDKWNFFRSQNPIFESPYFDLEFVLAVSRARDDVQVAVIHDNDSEVIGFLPFQKPDEKLAVPVGGLLNDLHGVLGDPQSKFCLLSILKNAGLKKFSFHGLIGHDNLDLELHEFRRAQSHYIDISMGWCKYEQWVRKNSVAVKRQGQKKRALERTFGPLRFEFDCKDHSVLEHVIKLKREKYQRTNTFDILSVDWASNLLREVQKVRKPEFRGSLSVAWAGDEVVAAHFGMLTNNILHYWFPVFDPKFSKYSPGTQLILDVVKACEARGVHKVDFGFGDDPFKFRFCNAHEYVSCGQVHFSRLAFNLAKRKFELRNQLKNMPMKSTAKVVLRTVFPGFGQWNFK